MNPFETYIRELYTAHATGANVAETSHYGALANLLNEIGKTLKPKVSCVINLRNQGAGLPDGGLFTSDQLRKHTDTVFDQVPSRGAIEVKGTSDDVLHISQTKQVRDYVERYGLVLVTNYRDFLLIQRGDNGIHTNLERYTLADSQEQFWREAAHPRSVAERHGERFIEYLKRVMQRNAPLADPKDLAWFLASYARDAKARIESAKDMDALKSIRAALEEALGLQFKDEKGEHFFRSTLVQTLFYGLFSAWVLWCKQNKDNTSARFDWRMAQWSLHVPMIRVLFEQISAPSKLGPLQLEDIMTWAGETLNRVDSAVFFDRFQEEHAVQYFYEPFLEAFDPELRKDLGVWYTPPEIIEYMVERVDTVLREELGIADGLADPSVYILDPCCGTGAYLVEVLKRIEKTLKSKRNDALIGHDIKKAATSRVFGFEILPAPFVIAHMQLGLFLQSLSAPLKEDGSERAGVYLTNALTGWEPPQEPKDRLLWPELEQERDAADEVKRDKPILVILGNPPYNAFAGTSPKEEQGLVEPYKEGLISEWGIKKFNMDDLYVRFFRLAERRIAEVTGKGVVCYISNYSYLSDASYVVMRQRFLKGFDSLWFDSMNGDSRETGKLTPDGKPDPSVFSTQYNREGIRLGTTIGLMVRKGARTENPAVRFRQFWGVNKRQDVKNSLAFAELNTHYRFAEPIRENLYSFRPEVVASHYRGWLSVADLCGFSPSLGILANRKDSLISIDANALEQTMRTYMDANVPWDDIVALGSGLSQNAARFDACAARTKLLLTEGFDAHRICRIFVRPMDTRWCYYTGVRPVWNEPRPAYAAQCWTGNVSLVTRRRGVASPEGVPFYCTSAIGFQHALNTDAYFVPLRWDSSLTPNKDNNSQTGLFQTSDIGNVGVSANLSPKARAYLGSLGISDPDSDSQTAGLIWMHVLAIGYSPLYLSENADGIRQDWPRIPLPNSKDMLLASAELGAKVAALLDTEKDVPGVTSGSIMPELQNIGVLTASCGDSLNPDAGDLALKAGWGHAGKDGVTMPGKGKLESRTVCNKCGFGESTFDVYLNSKAYWKNIPSRVWDYHIGGYQVIKKWLSYREFDLLKRPLKPEEALEVTNIARRIAAILLLEPDLDSNYNLVKNNTYPWPLNK
ncbi:MAG: type ISP restriction/modification enzyme [Armatimonadota bacterium]